MEEYKSKTFSWFQLKDVRLSSGEGSSKAKRVHPSETLPPKESLSSCKKMKTILYDSDLDVVGAGQSTMHDPKLTVSGSSNHGERDKEVVELHASNLDWKPLERDLYLKGVEVFGKDRYGVSHTENTLIHLKLLHYYLLQIWFLLEKWWLQLALRIHIVDLKN